MYNVLHWANAGSICHSIWQRTRRVSACFSTVCHVLAAATKSAFCNALNCPAAGTHCCLCTGPCGTFPHKTPYHESILWFPRIFLPHHHVAATQPCTAHFPRSTASKCPAGHISIIQPRVTSTRPSWPHVILLCSKPREGQNPLYETLGAYSETYK